VPAHDTFRSCFFLNALEERGGSERPAAPCDTTRQGKDESNLLGAIVCCMIASGECDQIARKEYVKFRWSPCIYMGATLVAPSTAVAPHGGVDDSQSIRCVRLANQINEQMGCVYLSQAV
jgi:hypothetical protein